MSVMCYAFSHADVLTVHSFMRKGRWNTPTWPSVPLYTNPVCGTATPGFHLNSRRVVFWRHPMALLAPRGAFKSMNPDLPLPIRRERCDTGAFAVCISASAPAWRADCSLFDTIVLPQAAYGWKTALNQPPEHKLCAVLYLCMPVMFWHRDHQWFESCSLMYSVLNTVNRVAVKEGMRANEAYRQSFCQNSLFQGFFSLFIFLDGLNIHTYIICSCNKVHQ